MDKLTPTARLTLDALRTGPGNVHELCERTGRSRSATDKALGELAKTNLIVKVADGGDPADGAPTRWQLNDPAPADGEPTQPEPEPDNDATTQPEAGQPDPGEDTTTDAEAADPAAPGGPDDPVAEPQQVDQAPAPESDSAPADKTQADTAPADAEQPNAECKPDGDTKPDDEAPADGEAHADGEAKADAEQPKLCRGCQAQMPKICECCWQKTSAFCGTCRKDMPQARRGEPGDPVILSNGLRKLRRGELEDLILKVLREHPLPAFAGIIGWTGGRVAIHLPGRSPSAINNALEKFTRTGECELIGDKPMRYKLKDTGTTDDEQADDEQRTDAASDNGQPETGQPPADGLTETTGPQPDAVTA